jgi:DNA replication protein DnaC
MSRYLPNGFAQDLPNTASGGGTESCNVVLLGLPGIGETHLATALGVTPAHGGHRFLCATDWVTRLTQAHQRGDLPREMIKPRRYALIIID